MGESSPIGVGQVAEEAGWTAEADHRSRQILIDVLGSRTTIEYEPVTKQIWPDAHAEPSYSRRSE